MTTLTVGDPAPAFSLPDADGRIWSPANFPSHRVIVYFYPAAMTPGCTIEAHDFTDALPVFANAGYEVVGISPDDPGKLAKFRDRDHITFPLLADVDRTTLDAYGAWGSKVLYGKEMEGVIRSTFIVDVPATGPATIVDARYAVKATGHVERLARDLGL